MMLKMINAFYFTELEKIQKNEYLHKILFQLTYLSKINNYELAKYISFFKICHYPANSIIFNKGDHAKYIYWVLEGSVVLDDQNIQIEINENEAFGDEALSNDTNYLLNAKTITKCTILLLESQKAHSLIHNNIKENYILQKFLSTMSGKNTTFTTTSKESQFVKIISDYLTLASKTKVIGWILTIFLPFLYYFFANNFMYINWNIHIFITIFIAILLMWSFRLIPEYVTSIFAILSILILNLAPQEVILSGFTDGSFYLALSIFTLSSLIVSSGFAYRIVLWILRVVPFSIRWHSYSLFFVGLFLTPILPSANGRIALIVPIIKNFIQSLGLSEDNAGELLSIKKIVMAAFVGTTMISTIFLSSKAIHFVIFGLLPEQLKERFSWNYWLYASLAAGIVLILGCIILMEIFYKKAKNPPITKKHIELQYLTLGKMSINEYAALGGILLFLIGIATSSLHKISLPWIGLMILYATLSLGFINHKDFRNSIDWTFLIFLASLIGFIKTFSYIGLDVIFAQKFGWVGLFMQKNFFLFIFLILGIIFIMRLFIPTNSTVAILASILFPIAQIYGINMWVIGFILLLFSDMWFFPYQSTYYIQFEHLLKDEKYFDEKDFVRFNLFSSIFRVLAVIVSIFYWQKIGIL